tara:strand:- start:1877 stop:2149 length:273 start_codon:yes stop_codon:yes gene_type:complete
MSAIPPSVIKSAKSDSIEVSVRIGRGGVSESIISELADQLDRRRLVKVKVNKGIVSDRDQRDLVFSEIEKSSNSTLVFQRGNVAVFWSGK